MKLDEDAAQRRGSRQAAGPCGAERRVGTAGSHHGQGDTSTEALLFATAATAEGGPAAALTVLGGTVLGRLLSQLESLGARRAWVATRPDWTAAVEEAAAESGVDVTVVPSDAVSDDLRLAADVAGRARGVLIVGNAHVLTHREALGGLLADPRIVSGALMSGSPLKASGSFAIRSLRGRIVSAESRYHRVEGETGYFLGMLKVGARDRGRLMVAARKLAEIAAQPPRRWDVELQRKEDEWRRRAWRAAVERETGTRPDPAEVPDLHSIRIDDATERDIALRRRAAAEDPVPLLLVGLVRGDADLFPSSLREFFHATPLSAEAAALAADELARTDESRVVLNSAVKANDGFFTTFFVSPYSKYLARFASRRGWTPNAITVVSLAIGLAAAASFALGSRWSLVAGAVLLQVSFTVDCVDGQLARYTRTFSKLGAWLDSVFDRMKEYVVYAGLAVGASRGFGDDVWLLAAATLTLQTMRHMSDFAYVSSQRRAVATRRTLPLDQPEDVESPAGAPPRAAAAAPTAAPPVRERLARAALPAFRLLRRSGVLHWGNRIVRLPIGERFALISLTAAIATPRVSFVALLAWGSVGILYALGVRILMSYGVPRRLLRRVLE